MMNLHQVKTSEMEALLNKLSAYFENQYEFRLFIDGIQERMIGAPHWNNTNTGYWTSWFRDNPDATRYPGRPRR